MKNNKTTALLIALIAGFSFLISCEDDVSQIGDSLISTDMTISVDSSAYNLFGKTIPTPAADTKGAYTLLGGIDIPEYGKLQCSYVTRFMPSETIQIPDSIGPENVDSVKMILTVPKRYVVGDSAAVQQLKVYSLIKQLPENITASFNPEGYYNPSSPLGTKSFNLTGLNINDSTFRKDSTVFVNVKLPTEIGRDAFKAYKEDPDLFIWPDRFAKVWPGVLVEPTFGQGCIEAVASTRVFAYFPQTVATSVTDENGDKHLVYEARPDSVCLFSSAPEVLSNVNMSFSPSASLLSLINGGKTIITTPVGYAAQIRFPAKEILESYWNDKFDLGVINNLYLKIPASRVPNNYGIGVPPALLMVKTSEASTFFAEGKIPDNLTSFYSTYNEAEKNYNFSSMRQYILNLKNKGKDGVTEEDMDFTLIPVVITTETYQDPNTGDYVTEVTSALPYLTTPTMVELDTEKAIVVFTYSSLIIN